MSTILDALKKVEQERGIDSAAARQRQLDALNPATEKARRGRPRRFIIRGVLALLVVLMAGTSLYFLLGQRQQAGSQATRSAPETSKAAAPQKKANSDIAQKRETPPTKPIRPPASGTTGEPQRKRPDTRRIPLERPNQPPKEKQPPIGGSTDAIEPTPAKRPTSRAPGTPAESAPTPRPKAQTPPPTRQPAAPPQKPAPKKPQPARTPQAAKASDNIPRLTDGSLKVQAIAWSPNRDESMAVINGKILREGGSVDDYTLVRIREDDVVVRKAGGEYRVLIGRN